MNNDRSVLFLRLSLASENTGFFKKKAKKIEKSALRAWSKLAYAACLPAYLEVDYKTNFWRQQWRHPPESWQNEKKGQC
jgi:hypothetical protein